ncbi:hypothetical protein GCM10027091_68750 [Streptomyces daliensis]
MAGHPIGGGGGGASKPTGFRERLRAALRGRKNDGGKAVQTPDNSAQQVKRMSPEEIRAVEALADRMGPSPRSSTAGQPADSTSGHVQGSSSLPSYDRGDLNPRLQMAAWSGFPPASVSPAAPAASSSATSAPSHMTRAGTQTPSSGLKKR